MIGLCERCGTASEVKKTPGGSAGDRWFCHDCREEVLQ